MDIDLRRDSNDRFIVPQVFLQDGLAAGFGFRELARPKQLVGKREVCIGNRSFRAVLWSGLLQ